MTEDIVEDTRSQPEKPDTIMRNPHLWVIIALMVILAVSYYADHLDLAWIPFGQRFFTSEYVHDLHRALFLIPMLYTAAVFHFRGALVVSLVVFCVVLSRAFFISPLPDPILRSVIAVVVASLATVLLGLVQERRLGEKKALSELDVAHHELHNDARLLRASEARYRGLFDNASDAIFVRDLEGNIIEVNQAASILTGYTLDELAKMNVSQFLSAESFKTVMERQQAQLQGEATTQRYELELIRKDGTKGIIESVTKLLTENGQPLGVQAIARDITEQKQLEKTLRESEERYRGLFDSSLTGAYIIGLERRILAANKAGANLLGLDRPEDLIGRSILDFYKNPKDRGEVIDRVKEGDIGSFEFEVVKEDGTSMTILISSLMIEFQGEKAILTSAMDITEQKRLRDNMQFYIAEITKAQEEERKRIARELHDETAQSLATMSLDIEAITRAEDQLSEETIQRLEQLRARIDSVIEGVRRFSHELRPGVLDQVGLMPALELLTEELNKEGKVKARIEVTGSEQRLSPEAELVLFRIAQEALHNVRRHSQATETVVRVEFTPKKVKLNVTDNGSGFELPEVLGDFAGKGKLGLIGMHERARLLDGSFSVKSQVGKGTTVTVEVAGQGNY